MPLLLLVVLAVVQGVTEFLPISSSAHLVLTREAWGGAGLAGGSVDPAAELTLDVALHVGTLFAVMAYFWRDVRELIIGGIGLLTGKRNDASRLAWLVLVATIPAFIAGAAFKGYISDNLRGIEIIAWTTLIFGVLLGVADRQPTSKRTLDLTWKTALGVGLAQATALIPGVSRSGVAMTAGRFLGLSREEAARYALLLALPTVAGAGALAGLDLYKEDAQVGMDAAIGAVLSCIAAYIAIWLMMRWLKHASFMPFVIYRVILGCVLLWIAYGGAG